MPRAKKRKDTEFQTEMKRSVFYYGNPNTGKYKRLEEIQSIYTALINRDIQLICNNEDALWMQLIKNDKKDPDVRKFEKACRKEGVNSAFCQNAFDEAFTKLSTRLDNIRLAMISSFGLFAKSKVLFALCLLLSAFRGKPKPKCMPICFHFTKSQKVIFIKSVPTFLKNSKILSLTRQCLHLKTPM